MTTTELKIVGMTCGHCTASVEEALGNLGGVESVKADLESGVASITHDESVTEDALKSVVLEIGFELS